jgi:hypothetical protein
MKTARLATLRFFSLLFLLPGLAGLVISAMVSTHYMDTLPRSPAPEELRTTPRSINGAVVFQTVEEDRRLDWMEYTSTGIFVIGLGLSFVYLEKWGNYRSRELDEDNEPAKTLG